MHLPTRLPNDRPINYQNRLSELREQQANLREQQVPEQEAKLKTIREAKLPKNYKVLVDKALAAILKDPESRKVEFVSTPYGGLVCGNVNAKNSYGGYVGKQPFFVAFDKSGYVSRIKIFSDEKLKQTMTYGKPGDIWYIESTLLKECIPSLKGIKTL